MIELKCKPLKIPLVINSRYDIRELGGFEFHPGIDYGATLGTPIYAVDNGYVAVTGNDAPGYGLYVVLDHGRYSTLYAHLKGHILRTGQLVKAGDVIGYVGMTGLTSGPHLHFEIRDCSYNDKNFWLKSNLKGRHVMCIDPEKFVEEAAEVPKVDSTVIYKQYNNNIHELKGNPTDLDVKIVDKRIWDITEWTNIVNGTFFWRDAQGKTYSTSPLIVDGVIYQQYCNHSKPQSVFIIYKDGTVALQKVTDVKQIANFSNVRIALGGIGLRNTLDKNFKYDPAGEGFSGVYADVLRKTNKTVVGYSKTTGKVYLLAVRNITHDDLIKLISTGESYDIAVSLDGGGSTFMDANKKYVFEGENTRRIHNIIGFNL